MHTINMHHKSAMRATLNLKDSLVQELVKLTGARTKTAAIHLAMEEAIRARKLEKLRALAGKIEIDPVWREHREKERRQGPRG